MRGAAERPALRPAGWRVHAVGPQDAATWRIHRHHYIPGGQQAPSALAQASSPQEHRGGCAARSEVSPAFPAASAASPQAAGQAAAAQAAGQRGDHFHHVGQAAAPEAAASQDASALQGATAQACWDRGHHHSSQAASTVCPSNGGAPNRLQAVACASAGHRHQGPTTGGRFQAAAAAEALAARLASLCTRHPGSQSASSPLITKSSYAHPTAAQQAAPAGPEVPGSLAPAAATPAACRPQAPVSTHATATQAARGQATATTCLQAAATEACSDRQDSHHASPSSTQGQPSARLVRSNQRGKAAAAAATNSCILAALEANP